METEKNRLEFDKDFQALLDSESSQGRTMIGFIERTLARLNLSESHDPLEILIEAYMRGINFIQSGGCINNTLAWIRSTAYNIIREFSRERKKILQPPEEGWVEQIPDDYWYWWSEDEEIAEKEIAEDIGRLKIALQNLSAEDKRILQLSIVENLSWKGIRQRLSVEGREAESEKILRKHKQRALKQLRKIYNSLEPRNTEKNNKLHTICLNISPNLIFVGGEFELTLCLNASDIETNLIYPLNINRTEAIANDLNIILTAPGFRFDGDNTTSLPLDPETANVTQTATFHLTALRPGTTKIQAELYCGATYKTTIETEVQISPFEETQLRPLIAARSRPVPQPDLILQVQTTWNADISTCTFNYHLDAFQPRLLFADDVDYNSQGFPVDWVPHSHALLKDTLEKAATSQFEDFRSRLASLGKYLFQCLFPAELQATLRTITGFKHPFTLLILADQDAWFPWELLHDGQNFLGESLIIGRWFWELEKTRPYEFPVGAVNVAHYANVEQPELWTELLQPSGAPPPIPLPGGVLADLSYTEAMGGLHLVRFGQSSDASERQNAPVQINGSNIDDIEREVRPAKLSLRRHRPLVSLGYVSGSQPELTVLEKTWASTFVRAGCSSFVGSLWAVNPEVEAAFVSSFYNSIWSGQSLGVAFQTARRLAKIVVPNSVDWLAYVLFGDPMARPYRPVEGQGYAVVEPIGQEIDDRISPGDTVRFRVGLRRTPPVWYENRLMEVAEDLIFDDLRVFIVTSGLQVTPDDSIVMRGTTTGDYLGWFTITVPAEMETRSVLVQVYFEDGMEPVHSLRFSLKIGDGDGGVQ